MPRIYWTVARKKRLLKQASEFPILILARKYHKPAEEIERVLRQISPDTSHVKQLYYERIAGKKVKVTVYCDGYASGIIPSRNIGFTDVTEILAP